MILTEEQDLRNRIHRMEDKLLREKGFAQQLQMHIVIQSYNKQLAKLIYRREQNDYT